MSDEKKPVFTVKLDSEPSPVDSYLRTRRSFVVVGEAVGVYPASREKEPSITDLIVAHVKRRDNKLN